MTMRFYAVVGALGALCLNHPPRVHAAETVVDNREPEITEQGRSELRDLLEREKFLESVVEEIPKNVGRKPAVLGAATNEPSEHREMYLDYSDSIPESSVETQR